MPVIASPVTASGLDLASAGYVTAALAAGGLVPSAAQATILPTLITAASREVHRFLGRLIPLASYTEVVAPEGGRQDRGEPASCKLSQFPVQGLTRCASGRTTVLLVSNTDPATNQEATVQLSLAGDVEWPGLVPSGLSLSRTASGAVTSTAIAWPATSPYTTVWALAATINALGGGWRAALPAASSGRPDLRLLPANYLVGARGPRNAFSPGAALDLFAIPLTSYDLDHATGILRFSGWGGCDDSWGAAWDGFGGSDGGVLGPGAVQVTYTAGFPTIPEGLQQVCAELVKATLERLNTDAVVKSETAGDYSYVVRDALPRLPEWATQTLTMYKDRWI